MSTFFISIRKSNSITYSLLACLLLVTMALSVVNILLSCLETYWINVYIGGVESFYEISIRVMSFINFLNTWSFFVPIILFLFLCAWMFQKYSYLQTNHIITGKYPPVMAIGGFVIPYLNFFMPLFVMRDIMRGVVPVKNLPIVGVWWTFYLLTQAFVILIYFFSNTLSGSADSYRLFYLFQAVKQSISLASSFFLAIVVFRIESGILLTEPKDQSIP